MKRNIIFKVNIIVLIVFVSVYLGNNAVDKIFYNPYQDFTTTLSTFSMLNQLLSPYITDSYLDKEQQGLPKFSYHSVGMRLIKFTYTGDSYDPLITGKICYHFGKAILEDFNDRLNIGDLTCQQKLFLEKPQGYQQSVLKDRSYEVWIKFKEPINSATFLNNYGWLLDNETSRPYNSGIMWIPVKTSDNMDDICIGLAGNLSFHYLNIYPTQDLYNMDLYGRESLFYDTLTYLSAHPKETNMFINLGIWANANTVNFKDRLDYIRKNKIQYLGFVAYIQGSDLLKSLENDSIEIARLNEQ
jgi:hypothetical protein